MTIAVPAFNPDGSIIDLANVRPDDISFTDMAAGLSKLARFNGIYRCPAYVVSQHCVMGADALFNETGDPVLSGYFLLHDGEEYLTGDWTRPSVALMDYFYLKVHRERFPDDRRSVLSIKPALDAAKASIQSSVFAAANLQNLQKMPLYRKLVKQMDDRMLRAEGIALFGAAAAPNLPAADFPPPRLTGAIKPWGPMKAEEAWLDRLQRYLGIEARAND